VAAALGEITEKSKRPRKWHHCAHYIKVSVQTEEANAKRGVSKK